MTKFVVQNLRFSRQLIAITVLCSGCNAFKHQQEVSSMKKPENIVVTYNNNNDRSNTTVDCYVTILKKEKYDQCAKYADSIYTNEPIKKTILNSWIEEMLMDLEGKEDDLSKYKPEMEFSPCDKALLREIRLQYIEELREVLTEGEYTEGDISDVLLKYMYYSCEIENSYHWYAADSYTVKISYDFAVRLSRIFAFEQSELDSFAEAELAIWDRGFVYFKLNKLGVDIFDESCDKNFYKYKEAFLNDEIVILIEDPH